uniref:Olfactory receptor family 2 subfamily O member 1 n=1 Tax=Jaculus jaculus TaxID=51337 RepID=A0A8C5K5E1_JACJA
LWNRTSLSSFIPTGHFSHSPYDIFRFFLILLASTAALAGSVFLLTLIKADRHMYFFLSQPSVMDLTMMFTVVPKMVASFLSGWKFISRAGCAVQIFLAVMVGGAEYVATCHLLPYPVLMSCMQACSLPAIARRAGGGATDGVIDVSVGLTYPCGGALEVDCFFCEVLALLFLSCVDTCLFEYISSTHVLMAVAWMPSSAGKQKVISTCSSHLAGVNLYYGGTIFGYMQQASARTPAGDRATSIFNTVLMPMFNPLIHRV